ncbi:cytochrome P450 [Tenacibaculum xiamenense]|uniref:cytochrome P450 n=1 Tax=Tenacibaculum xiamenense TaxID=1261553 RepID=UPI003894DD6B
MNTSNQTTLRTLKNLKSPKGTILLGHIREFKKKNIHLTLEKWAKELGKLYTLKFGPSRLLVSADDQFNNQILKQRPENFRRLSTINEVFVEMGLHTVFNAEGEFWKKQRKVVNESLNVKRVRSYYPIIKERNQNLIHKISSYAEDNQPVEILNEFVAFTIDVTTEIAFGYKLNTINNQKDRFQDELELLFPKINERMSSAFPVWRYFPSKEDKMLVHSLNKIKEIVNGFIQEAKTTLENDTSLENNPTNFLQAMLIESKKEGSVFDDNVLYGNVVAMLLAGEDTTSNTLAWTLFYLSQEPLFIEKIREEAQNTYSSDVPENYEQVSSLNYAKAAVQEAIRMNPTTPILIFQANKDVTIDNLFIPKNKTIILQNSYTPKTEEYFSEPEKFDPNRWISSSCPYQNHSPKSIKAFGGGARLCPGMHLSVIEMTSVISGICKNFEVKLEGDPKDIKGNFAFTVSPENLKLTFKKNGS